MAKRTKKTVISGVSREQYEQAFAPTQRPSHSPQRWTRK